MSKSQGRTGLLGIGVALGAAGIGTAIGVATDRLLRARDLADALDTHDDYVVAPDRQLAVVSSDGIPLHVEVDEPGELPVGAEVIPGPVPTVIFSHGYCLSRESWVFQRRAMKAAGYRVVVWDQRGHGLSERGTSASCTIDQIGDDLGRVIDAVAPTGPLALVGHSMGGMTILSYAEDRPAEVADRVIAVGLVATSPGGLPLAAGGGVATFGKAILGRFGPSVFGELSRRPGLVDGFRNANRDLEEYLVNKYSFGSPVPRGVVRLATRLLLGTNLQVMADFAPTFDVYDKTPVLRTFTGLETLVFNGVQDILTPPEHSEAIVRALPGAEHVLVNEAGHLIHMEHPDLLNEHLLATLARARRVHSSTAEVEPHAGVRRVVTDLAKRRRVAREKAALRRHHAS